MNKIKQLSLLWDQFDLAWTFYIQDYQRRIQSIADIHKLIETFNYDTDEAKAIKLKIMEESVPDIEINNPPELTLKEFLTLAKKLNNYEKFPIIKERLQLFYKNINTIWSLQNELDDKFNSFMKRNLSKE